MKDFGKITGIILAGGFSSRMGRDKGLIEYKGKKLVEYSVKVLEQFCDQIFISSNTDDYKFLGYPVIADKVPTSGPLAGIYSCMIESSNEINIVLPCDTPHVKPELFDYILQYTDRYDCIVPSSNDGKMEPLCAYYNKNLLPVIKEFIDVGNYRIPDIYKIIRFYCPNVETQDFYTPELFTNINYPQDL